MILTTNIIKMHDYPNFSLNTKECHFHKSGYIFKGLSTEQLTLENTDRISQRVSKLMGARHTSCYMYRYHKNFLLCADRELKNEVLPIQKKNACLLAHMVWSSNERRGKKGETRRYETRQNERRRPDIRYMRTDRISGTYELIFFIHSIFFRKQTWHNDRS